MYTIKCNCKAENKKIMSILFDWKFFCESCVFSSFNAVQINVSYAGFFWVMPILELPVLDLHVVMILGTCDQIQFRSNDLQVFWSIYNFVFHLDC